MLTKELRRHLPSIGKQNRASFKKGVPKINELTELVPVFRETSEGLVQYVRYNNKLYKSVFVLDGRISGGVSVG